MRAVDRMGDRYGRLVVVARAENGRNGSARWVCDCDCGTTITARGANLANGATRSCGCLKISLARLRQPVTDDHARATAAHLSTCTPAQVQAWVDKVINDKLAETRPGYLRALMTSIPLAD